MPRQPVRAQGVGGHLLCCGSSTMAPHRPPRRASHLGSGPGRALGALLPGPGRIREGATIPCREHGEERRQRRRPAQGQPGGTPRPGRVVASRLVADASCIVLLGAPCRASQGAGVAPEILPRARPLHPKPLARGPREFLSGLLGFGWNDPPPSHWPPSGSPPWRFEIGFGFSSRAGTVSQRPVSAVPSLKETPCPRSQRPVHGDRQSERAGRPGRDGGGDLFRNTAFPASFPSEVIP